MQENISWITERLRPKYDDQHLCIDDYQINDVVDLWDNELWWEGVVVDKDEEKGVQVAFPGTLSTKAVKLKNSSLFI